MMSIKAPFHTSGAPLLTVNTSFETKSEYLCPIRIRLVGGLNCNLKDLSKVKCIKSELKQVC